MTTGTMSARAAGKRISSWARAHRDSAMVALFLLALTLLFFFPLLTGRTFTTVAGHQNSVYPWRASPNPFPDFPQNDQADLNYPWQAFISDSLSKGAFPFWNPLAFGGQPFFANGSSAVLYPPRLILSLVVSPGWAHDLFSVLHVFLSGLFMYGLVRDFGTGRAGSLLAAVSWMFCSFNLAWLHLEVVTPISVLLPLSVLLCRRAVERPSMVRGAWASAALAFLLISGHLPFASLAYLVALGYGGCLALRRSWHDRARRPLASSHVLRVVGMALTPPLLAAVVLIPTLLFLRSLGRQAFTYEALHDTIRVPKRVFLGVFRPPPLPVTAGRMHEMAFVGLPAFLLGIVGFFSRRTGAAFARTLSVIVLLVAIDTPLTWLAFKLVPGFNVFWPLGRLLNLFAFAVAILGGIGLDVVVRRLASSTKRPEIMHRLAQGTAALAVVVAVAQLVPYGWRVNPRFTPRDPNYSYSETPLIQAIQAELSEEPAPGRMFPVRRTIVSSWTAPVLYANESMVAGIESASGYDSAAPDRAETLWRIISGFPAEEVLRLRQRRAYVPDFQIERTRFDLLPRLGVTAVVVTPDGLEEPAWQAGAYRPLSLKERYSGPDGALFRIEGSTGGPYVVFGQEVYGGEEPTLRRFLDPGLDFKSTVVFDRADLPRSEEIEAAAGGRGEARVIAKGVNDMVIDVNADQAGWLVVPDTWDPGWQASINGERVPVRRADYAFRAIRFPPGASRIVMSYRPAGFNGGLLVSSIAVASVTLLVWRSIRTRRRHSPSSTPPL